MREIKFRVWDEKRSKFHYFDFGDIVGGDIVVDLDPDCIGSVEYVSVYEFDIEQYTGLKDKNGKEIFEGDKLKYDGSPIYTVVWERDRYKMTGRKNGNGFSVDIPAFMEIIGNIHEAH